jgi:hypothetical protein
MVVVAVSTGLDCVVVDVVSTSLNHMVVVAVSTGLDCVVVDVVSTSLDCVVVPTIHLELII